MLRILIFAIAVVAIIVLAARLFTRASTPSAGALAPDFTLPSQDGTPVSLRDFRGNWVVLYFYPKDQTPG